MTRQYTAALLFFLSAGLMVALTQVAFSWASFAPEACGVRNCYCEPFRAGFFVRQPITALSNLGYVLVGALILAAAPSRQKNALQNERLFPRWFAAALFITGWASFLSHASLTRLGEWLDLMGVYQLLLVLLVYSLHRLTGRNFLVFYGVALFVFGAQMVIAPQWQQVIIAGILSAWVAAEVSVRKLRRPQGKNRFTLLAVIFFAAGAGIWMFNGRAPQCPPGAFPWHLAWHLLSAAAFRFLYRYFDSETLPTTP